MKKFFKILIRIIIALVIVVGIAAGGYYLYLQNQAKQRQTALASLQFTRVTKGNLSATVGATGNIRTTQSAVVSWQTSGQVGTINVKVGDKVKANQVLASLDPNSLPQSMIQAQADLINAQTALTNLETTDPVALATAEKAVVDAQNAVDTATNTRSYYNYQLGSQSQIDALYAKVLVDQQNVSKAQDAFDKVMWRATDDPYRAQAQAALSQANATLATDKQNLAYLQGKGTPTDVGNADAALALSKAQLQDAIDNLNQLKAGPKASDLAAAQAKIAAIQAQLAEKDIVAPFDGTVTEVNIMKGDLVSPGTAAFQIDVVDKMYIDLQVSELDINKMQDGQAVQITFDGVPNKTYNGTVSNIGTIGVTSSGVVNFPVTVVMTDPDASVKSGMSASANIVTSQVDNVLLLPARAVHTVSGQQVVYTFSNTGTFTPVKVTVGMSNDTSIEIKTGVTEGERLVVNPPSNLTLAGGGTNPFAALFGIRTAGGFGGGFGGGGFGGGGGNFRGANPGGGTNGGTNSGTNGGTRSGTTGGNSSNGGTRSGTTGGTGGN